MQSFPLAVLLRSKLNWKPWDRHELNVLYFILILGLYFTGKKKSPPSLTPVFGSKHYMWSVCGALTRVWIKIRAGRVREDGTGNTSGNEFALQILGNLITANW